MAYEGPLDMTRPLMYCTHKASGARIFMYLDAPGEYLDQHARSVPEEMALEAGFQVERFRKQRIFIKERAKFEEALKTQLQVSDAVEVYKEVGDLKLLHYPETGLAYLEREGVRLNDTPIPLSTAVILFDQFAKMYADERAEETKVEPGIAKSTEAAPSPPPTSPSATKGAKVGAAAMLK